MKYEAVLFDMDGTLLDTIEVIALAVNTSLRRLRLPTHPTEAYKKMIGDGASKLCERALPEELRQNEDILRDARTGFECVYLATQNSLTRLYDGIEQLLADLRKEGVKMAIITNKPHELALESAADLLPDCFEIVLGQSDENPCKPDPTTALRAASHMGLAPEKCVFLGDSCADMKTGVGAGMASVAALWGFSPRALLADCGAKFFAEHPADVLRLVQGGTI